MGAGQGEEASPPRGERRRVVLVAEESEQLAQRRNEEQLQRHGPGFRVQHRDVLQRQRLDRDSAPTEQSQARYSGRGRGRAVEPVGRDPS